MPAWPAIDPEVLREKRAGARRVGAREEAETSPRNRISHKRRKYADQNAAVSQERPGAAVAWAGAFSRWPASEDGVRRHCPQRDIDDTALATTLGRTTNELVRAIAHDPERLHVVVIVVVTVVVVFFDFA